VDSGAGAAACGAASACADVSGAGAACSGALKAGCGLGLPAREDAGGVGDTGCTGGVAKLAVADVEDVVDVEDGDEAAAVSSDRARADLRALRTTG
jgi:hypothetical protein